MADLRKENTGLVTENLQAKTAIADLEMNLASLKQDFAIQSELKSNFQSHLERSQNQIKELQGKLAMAIAKNEVMKSLKLYPFTIESYFTSQGTHQGGNASQ